MLTIQNPTHRTPHRILVIGAQQTGKTMFARRLSQWLVANHRTGAATIQDGDARLPPRTQRHVTIVTLNTKPSSRVLNRFDWIVDMDQRPPRVNGVCDTCRGDGLYRVMRTNVTVPCHGYDCAKRVPSCTLAEEAPNNPTHVLPRSAELQEADAQLAKLAKETPRGLTKGIHATSSLAGDVRHGLSELATLMDRALHAIATAAPLNKDAQERLQWDIRYHFTKTSAAFAGLAGIIERDRSSFEIYGNAPF